MLDHRRRFIRPIVDDFERWLRAVAPSLLPSEPLAAAVRYYLNHGDALFRFIDDPVVPIDNSPTEREFQNVAKLRLNMLFAGSTEGAHRACVLVGIAASRRPIGVPVQSYLAWAFERLGTHRDVYGLAVEEMTPAAFKTAIGKPARSRRASARGRSALIPASLIGHRPRGRRSPAAQSSSRTADPSEPSAWHAPLDRPATDYPHAPAHHATGPRS